MLRRQVEPSGWTLQAIGVAVFAGLAVALFPTGPASGAGPNDGLLEVPREHATIQEAIEVAEPGELVIVAPGVYRENLNFLGKSITVLSEAGPEVTVVDGGGVDAVVTLASGEGRGAVLEGFTLTNGHRHTGGGIWIRNSSPTVRGNVITQNTACGWGGGVAAEFSAALIESNEISENGIQGCSTGSPGGGVFIGGAGAVELVGNYIHHNTWQQGAGLGLNAAGAPRIEGNIIADNVASGAGGGVQSINRSGALFVQNLIVRNVAVVGGGLDWSAPSGTPIRLLANTIADNSVSGDGSAVRASGFDPHDFTNNILTGSSGSSVVFCDSRGPLPPSFSHNDVFAGAGGVAYGGDCPDVSGSLGNVSVDPQFADAAVGDYTLAPTSPLIEAGVADSSLPARDLAGMNRVLNGIAVACGAVIDIGVYEFELVADSTAPTVTISSPPTTLDQSALLTASWTADDDQVLCSVLATLDATPVEDGETRDPLTLSLGTHVLEVSAFDWAGNETTVQHEFEVTASVPGLCASIEILDQQGEFIGNSFVSALRNKCAEAAAAGPGKARQILEEMAHQITVQTGNGITPAGASILLAQIEAIVG